MNDDLWKLTIVLKGKDFASLKSNAKYVLTQVMNAKTFKEFPMYAGDMYSINCTCPIEARIAELRKEADELEAGLSSGEVI